MKCSVKDQRKQTCTDITACKPGTFDFNTFNMNTKHMQGEMYLNATYLESIF